MAVATEDLVELGFLEETLSWQLASKFFPSKVGGWPSWLNLKDIPSIEQLLCKKCGHPCVFLLQVYAPKDDPASFHRTIFIFACKNGDCYSENCNKNFIVLRNQLSRENEFYSYDPPEEVESDAYKPSAENWSTLCHVCGSKGNKKCAECKAVHYCSKEHQIFHWKSTHKTDCKKIKEDPSSSISVYLSKSKLLFPEFEIVTEPEKIEEKPEKSDSEKMKEFYNYVKSEKTSTQLAKEFEEKDLEAMASKEDKVLSSFKKRISCEPSQVLRYQSNGQPLWISGNNVPGASIPNCKCGAERQFEFQVMPQLLNHLQVDSLSKSIDWGVLSIYTCSKNCSSGDAYKEEFLWKQDFLNDE